MSPYRVPAQPIVDAPSGKRWPLVAAVLGLSLGAEIVLLGLEVHQALVLEIELERLETEVREAQRTFEESTPSRFDHPGVSAEERASLEAQLEAVKRKQQELVGEGDLVRSGGQSHGGVGIPQCKCADGDPLCAEIPGQTCMP